MLTYLIVLAINIISILIIARAILSWLPNLKWRYREISRLIDSITEPFLTPFRRLVPPHNTGGIDISPMLAIVVLQILARIIPHLLRALIG